MSKITAGQVEIVLDDETLILTPTLEASTAISRRFEGLNIVRAISGSIA